MAWREATLVLHLERSGKAGSEQLGVGERSVNTGPWPITESGCCRPTGLPASNTKHNLNGSERKDLSSTQLSNVPVESQVEELTTRCPLPHLPERVVSRWRCR